MQPVAGHGRRRRVDYNSSPSLPAVPTGMPGRNPDAGTQLSDLRENVDNRKGQPEHTPLMKHHWRMFR